MNDAYSAGFISKLSEHGISLEDFIKLAEEAKKDKEEKDSKEPEEKDTKKDKEPEKDLVKTLPCPGSKIRSGGLGRGLGLGRGAGPIGGMGAGMGRGMGRGRRFTLNQIAEAFNSRQV